MPTVGIIFTFVTLQDQKIFCRKADQFTLLASKDTEVMCDNYFTTVSIIMMFMSQYDSLSQ